MSADEPASPKRPLAARPGLGPGAVVARRYELRHLINAGGQGAVYEVHDRHNGRTRAMKVLLGHHLRDEAIVKRFEREARLTAEIESDHLVEVLDAGVDELSGTPFLVMERLRGEDLGERVARRGGLPWKQVVVYLRQAALAIDKAHQHGIIHRDLKPENLFLGQRDDGTPRVRVFDFGIAKVLDGTSAVNTQLIGTPMYMAPEQLRSEAKLGPECDIFALGQIAFTLLVGRPYWDEEGKLPIHAFLVKLLLGPPESVCGRAARIGESVPPAFEVWMNKACAPVPSDRHRTAGDAIAALERVFDPLDLGDDATEIAPERVALPRPIATGPLPEPVAAPTPTGEVRRGTASVEDGGSTKDPVPAPNALRASSTTTTGLEAALTRTPQRSRPILWVGALLGALSLAAGAVHVSRFGRLSGGTELSGGAAQVPAATSVGNAGGVAGPLVTPAPFVVEARAVPSAEPTPAASSARSAKPEPSARTTPSGPRASPPASSNPIDPADARATPPASPPASPPPPSRAPAPGGDFTMN